MKNTILIAGIIVFTMFSCKSKNAATASNTPSTPEQSVGTDQKPQRGGNRPNPEEVMKKMDVDGDGKLSKSEVKGPLVERFPKIDTNNDGYITLEELKNAPRPNRPEGGKPRR